MDIAHIVPPRLVEQFEPGRIAMIYVDWVLDHDRGTGYHYVDYWKEAESTYKILDHSFFELMVHVAVNCELFKVTVNLGLLEYLFVFNPFIIHSRPAQLTLPGLPGIITVL